MEGVGNLGKRREGERGNLPNERQTVVDTPQKKRVKNRWPLRKIEVSCNIAKDMGRYLKDVRKIFGILDPLPGWQGGDS